MAQTKVLYDGTVKSFFEQYGRVFFGITYIGCSQDFANFLNNHSFIHDNGIKASYIWTSEPQLEYPYFAQQIRDMYEGNLIVLKYKYIIQDTLDNHPWSKEQYENIINYLKTFTYIHEEYFDSFSYEFKKNTNTDIHEEYFDSFTYEFKKNTNTEYDPGKGKVISLSPEIIYEVSRFELLDL